MTETAEPVLVCVAPNQIAAFWRHASPLIAAAYETGIGDDTMDTIRRDLETGDALLWIVWDGTMLAAVTTKLLQTAARRICLITSCAGREMARWIHLISGIENYARREDCDAVRVMGRPGWKAMLPDYREPWVFLQKDLR